MNETRKFLDRAMEAGSAGGPPEEELRKVCRELRRSTDQKTRASEEALREYHALHRLRGIRKICVNDGTLAIHTETVFMRLTHVPILVRLRRFRILIPPVHRDVRIIIDRPFSLWVHIHPHINNPLYTPREESNVFSNVCWGVSAGNVRRLREEGDIVALVQFILLFLEITDDKDAYTERFMWWRPWRPIGYVSRALNRAYVEFRNWVCSRVKSLRKREEARQRDYVEWRSDTIVTRLEDPTEKIEQLYFECVAAHRGKDIRRALRNRLRVEGVCFESNRVTATKNGKKIWISPSGKILVDSRSIIADMGRQNPELLVGMAKLAGGMYMCEMLQLVDSFRTEEEGG